MQTTPDTDRPHGPFATLRPFALASASPRRIEFLTQAGLDFEIMPSRAEEPPPLPSEHPEDYVMRMARLKAQEVAERRVDMPVLAADTVVVVDNTILGKPRDDADALAMLTRLCGRSHQVVTGVCLLVPGQDPVRFATTTEVLMRTWDRDALAAYVATGEPRDKAGAYAIQGIGTFLVGAISGSYSNVVGLPLARVLEVLLSSGVVVTRHG